MGKSIDALTDEERIAYYRQLASDALQLAKSALTDDQRAAYNDVALRWTLIAADVERWTRRQQERARLHSRKANDRQDGDGRRH